MSVDPDLAAAAEKAYAAPAAPSGHLNALDEMRDLVRTTADARVKAQLLRILREEERAAATAPENELAEVPNDQLLDWIDQHTAADIRTIFKRPDSPLAQGREETIEAVLEIAAALRGDPSIPLHTRKQVEAVSTR